MGDALGAQVEFYRPNTFPRVREMVGGGPHSLKAGEWTDDTIMALCLAESLIECQAFDGKDQMQRYVRYWTAGYLSPKGYCFDIGAATEISLQRFLDTREPYVGATYERSAANGSIMRLAPVPLFYARDPRQAIENAGLSSRTTHALPVCVDACRYLAALMVGVVNGASKEDILSDRYEPIRGLWRDAPLHPEIDEIAYGSFKEREPPVIAGQGHVPKTLEAALWAFDRNDDFEKGALSVVNLGDDADTTGAVYGQLAGAYYGEQGIPVDWLSKLYRRELIISYAEKLHELARGPRRPR